MLKKVQLKINDKGWKQVNYAFYSLPNSTTFQSLCIEKPWLFSTDSEGVIFYIESPHFTIDLSLSGLSKKKKSIFFRGEILKNKYFHTPIIEVSFDDPQQAINWIKEAIIIVRKLENLVLRTGIGELFNKIKFNPPHFFGKSLNKKILINNTLKNGFKVKEQLLIFDAKKRIGFSEDGISTHCLAIEIYKVGKSKIYYHAFPISKKKYKQLLLFKKTLYAFGD